MENKKFAWWPKTVTSGKIVWLAYYYQHKTLYDRATGRPPLDKLYFEWSETEQEHVWRLLKQHMVERRNIWNNPELTKEDKI